MLGSGTAYACNNRRTPSPAASTIWMANSRAAPGVFGFDTITANSNIFS